MGYFLSVEEVEDQSTIDKWKKSRIPLLFCFSFLYECFVFHCNIIWAVFYLVGNANMDCVDRQILNNNLLCVQKIETN